MTDTEREFPFNADVLALAFHRAQVCPHGMGPDPAEPPDNYLDRDREIAALIADEYGRIYEEVEEAVIEEALEQLVADGLVERVPA